MSITLLVNKVLNNYKKSNEYLNSEGYKMAGGKIDPDQAVHIVLRISETDIKSDLSKKGRKMVNTTCNQMKAHKIVLAYFRTQKKTKFKVTVRGC